MASGADNDRQTSCLVGTEDRTHNYRHLVHISLTASDGH